MKFAIGSTSRIKINAAKKVIRELLKGKNDVIGYKSVSKVPETPIGKHTINGARNRARDAKSNLSSVDYYIGVESGLVNRYGNVYEEAWCCIIDKKGKEYYAYSSGLKVPDLILDAMKRKKITHHEVMEKLQANYNMPRGNTWGNYTGYMLDREASIKEAIRNALVQALAGKKSIYKGVFTIDNADGEQHKRS